MKASETLIRTIVITDVPDHGNITVTLEDLPGGAGRVTTVEGGTINTAYWTSLGSSTIAHKVLTTENLALLGLFDPFGTLYRKIDPAVAKQIVVADITAMIEAGQLTNDVGESLIANTTRFTPVADINGIQAMANDLMTSIYGPAWAHTAAPKLLGQHPEYKGLLERIQVLKQVLDAK